LIFNILKVIITSDLLSRYVMNEIYFKKEAIEIIKLNLQSKI